ncbi:MAG: hypothetical protein E7597_05485 [Ruminococcaceae bacterium]|nr:hypothetical protein [Oscillospiraceae bacterium]
MCKYAVVLAGGFGRRLFPITEAVPKPLLPLGNSTVYGILTDKLAAAGFTQIAVTTMYKGEQIEAYPVALKQVKYFRETMPLGTAGSVKNAAAGFDDCFLVVSGDTVSDFDFKEIMEKHRRHGGLISVVCKRVTSPTEYGTVAVDGDIITEFTEKPNWRRTLTNLVNTGIYVMSPGLLPYIGTGQQDFAADLFPRLLREGVPIHCIEEQGFWCDIGDVESYYRCCFCYEKGENVLFGSASAAEDAAVSGSVLFDGVTVDSGGAVYGSILCGGVYVGKNAFIGKGCVIGAGTIIGDGAYIAGGTILKAGLNIEKGTRVMKSVIFGELRKRHIENGRISGRYGTYINGELCLRLGGALAYTAGAGSAVGVFGDGSSEAKALADSILCGVRIYGGRACDMGEGFGALAAFSAVEYKLAYALTVAVRGGVVTLSLFDGDGLPPTTKEERAVEAALSRPVPTSVSAGELLSFAGEEAPKYRYAARLTHVTEGLRGAKLYVGEKNPASEFLYSVAHKMGAEVDYSTGTDRDMFYVSADGLYAEARLGADTECGFWGLLCIAAATAKGEVALPTLCPRFVEEAVERAGGKAVFYGDAMGRQREAAARCFWSVDGNALVLKALESALKLGKPLENLYLEMPRRVIEYKTLPMDEEKKAEAMEKLSTQGEKGRGGEGIRIRYSRGSVTVIPQNGGGFRLFAEAVSNEAAEEIFVETEKKIKGEQD